MDKIEKEQQAIEQAKADLEARTKRLEVIGELTEEQREAYEYLYRDEGTEKAGVTLLCPVAGCGRNNLQKAGILRHITSMKNKGDEAHTTYRDSQAFEDFKSGLHS